MFTKILQQKNVNFWITPRKANLNSDNENRASVFISNLFHETDNYEFKEGY